jgi:hypothetical protein
MPNLQLVVTEHVLTVFRQHNRAQSQRTVELTRRAIAKLEAEGQRVTLSALTAATRAVDTEQKGLAAKTILRNAEACALFHQHSSAYQQRQARAPRVKRRRSCPHLSADTRAIYRGLRTTDLIQMIEASKQSITEMKKDQARLQAERDEAYRQRDEALQQNVRQLAVLTELKERLGSRQPAREGKQVE